MEYLERIKEASKFISSYLKKIPDAAVILGTGLGSLAEEIEGKTEIPYSNIPNFPISTAPGHAGKLILGFLEDKYVIAMSGRFHYYEGYSMKEVTLPVRVFMDMGIKILIVSNACGGMNPKFKAGDLMLITDHINLLGDNPLIGKNIEEFGPRFPDMSEVYDKGLIKIAEKTAAELGIDLKEGVYVSVSGPNFETPAELRMLRAMGADAVGMSTVPEVIAARHGGIKVLGISCITDMAIADGLEPLDAQRVIETADRTRPIFVKLVKEIIKKFD